MDDGESTSQDRKGKRRATVHEEPTDRTPLLSQLAGTSQLPWQVVNTSEEAAHQSSRRRLWAKLMKVFLITLSISILFLVCVALLAWSYATRASDLTPQDIINKHLVFKGPDKLDVVKVTSDGGVWLNVQGRLGVDIGDALGINSSSDDGILGNIWKSIGRQGVRTLGNVSLNLSTITILPELHPYQPLAYLDVPPMQVPLSVDPPKDGSWLTTVTIPALLHPTTNATIIASFLKDAWKRGYFAVRADVDDVYVRGGLWDKPSWRTKFHGKLSNIQASLRLQVPPIPGLPHPGADIPFPAVSELITLKSFTLYSTPLALNLDAEASIVNPAPSDLQFTSPPLQFTASLPTKPNIPPIQIASITAAPFSLTHPNITLSLNGSVLPVSPSAFPTLSTFLTRFLSGLSNPIQISLHSIPSLSVEAEFPGPSPRPHILQNVTIRDMKLKPTTPSGQFLASGIVQARIVLPKGMVLGMNVSLVLPDVLIFDGEVSDGDETRTRTSVSAHPPPGDPLPDPLPERAFGHIRPDDWLVAKSAKSESGEDEGSAYAVSAKVTDVPLEVLPGRQKEFSNFVSKVIFNPDGALAGIQGTAAVRVSVQGLSLGSRHDPSSSHLDLGGLPFQGSVRINKKSLFDDHLRELRHILKSNLEALP